jgi:PAS domain S-box-containing protein
VQAEVKIIPMTATGSTAFMAMVRNVATESKLRLELQRLSGALDHADEAFIIADADGVVEYINAAARNLNGGVAAPAKGSRLKANLAAEDNEKENRGMWETLRIGRSWKSEISRLCDDGSRKFEEVFVYPVKDHEGRNSNYLAVRRDISSRKHSEKLISNLSRAIEHSAEMIVVTDLNGTIEYVNPSVSKILGYSAEELIGAKPNLFKSGFHDEKLYKQMWDVVSRGEPWSGRITNRKKSGELIEEELSISPVFGERGDVVNFVAVARDGTSRASSASSRWGASRT